MIDKQDIEILENIDYDNLAVEEERVIEKCEVFAKAVDRLEIHYRENI